jgi:hypothetical protein
MPRNHIQKLKIPRPPPFGCRETTSLMEIAIKNGLELKASISQSKNVILPNIIKKEDNFYKEG